VSKKDRCSSKDFFGIFIALGLSPTLTSKGYNSDDRYRYTCKTFAPNREFSRVGQSNIRTQVYLKLTPVVTITKVCEFEHYWL